MHDFLIVDPSGFPDSCPRCGGEMRPGVALQDTYSGVPDFIGDEVVTVSFGSTARMVDCAKCAGCGYSRNP